jgi:hypothetical protein
MRGIAGWFTGKGEDDRQRIQVIEDPTKSLKKRFTTLQQILKGFEKGSVVAHEEAYSQKLHEFLRTHASLAVTICTEYLMHLDTNKGRSRLWEDAFSSLDILVEMAKYGCYSIDSPGGATAYELAKGCLNDTNRTELRDRGFRLLLNLLNNSPDEPSLRSLLLEAIDLQPFVLDAHIVLPDRTLLKGKPNLPFVLQINETLNKFRPAPQLYAVPGLGEFQEASFYSPAQNTLHFLSAALAYVEKSDFPLTKSSRSEHFRRWFNNVLRPVFYLLYPSITQEASIDPRPGFNEGCPLSLHFLIINWLIRCISDDDLRSLLMTSPLDYGFVMEVIGHTFKIKEAYSNMQYSVVEKVLVLYHDWLGAKFLGNYAAENFQKHVEIILKNAVQLCSIIKSQRNEELWIHVIDLLDSFRVTLSEFRRSAMIEHRPILVETILLMAQKLQEITVSAKSIQDIIEPSVPLILNLLSDFQIFEVPWDRFQGFLSTWAQRSEKIVIKWFEVLERLTDEYKALNYSQGPFADGWLQMFGVLGNPLLMQEQVQLTWTSCVRRLIQNMLSPHKLAPSCNFLASLFFGVLASLMWKAELPDTRQVALESLLDILVEARGHELPNPCYLHHFSTLVCLKGEEQLLTPTILMRLPSLLEHSSMHIHIPKLVSLALDLPAFSLRLVFALLSFPNHYGASPLLSYTNSTNYLSLKKLLRQLLLKCCITAETAAQAVYGLSVFIIEELLCGHEKVSTLVIEDLMSLIMCPTENVASTALHCLCVLAPVTADLSPCIVGFLLDVLKKLRSEEADVLKKQRNEELALQILKTLQNLLINNPQLAMEHDLVKKLYASLHELHSSSSRLSEELEVMVSFLMHYFSNFPLKNCPRSVMCSTIPNASFAGLDDFLSDTGPCEAEQMHFVLNEDTLLSVFILESRCRFLLRNAFGKFAWNADNFRLFNSPEEHDDKDSYAECVAFFTQANIELVNGAETEELLQQTVLEDLLGFMVQTYPECSLNDIPSSIPRDRNFLAFDSLERTAESWPLLTTMQPAKLNLARALMSHLNLLEEAKLLESGEQLNRAINELDKMQCREIVKLGVIYVGQGQQDQKEILANSTASPEFIEFIQSLGSVVDVKTHEGYLGGIDREGSVGKQTISYADWHHDVVYHVIPLMPTDVDDDQQISKKRHVGNDCVHVVWSEHWRDYQQDTITSHFNFTHIVVYPLPNGLYRIQIHMKHPSLIGPLQDGMVVSKPILVPLVVETAIQANNIVRQKHFERYQPMLDARIEKIKDIKTRYANISTAHEEMLVALS